MLKILRLGAALLFGALPIASSVQAQEFPTRKPIKIIVGFNPGGGSDVMARITAEFLQKRLGQVVVVENRPGAASAIAAEYVAKSKPDGYTLFVTTAELSIIPAVRSNLPYDFSQFTFLARPFSSTPLVVVGPNSPIASMKDLISQIKLNPQKLRYGTPGVGSLNHLGTVALEQAVGAKGVHVPYTGASAVYTDLLAGVIDFYTGASLPIPEGLKVLGPAGAKRHPAYPNLPTLEELGYSRLEHEAWWGVVAPPGLPDDIANRLRTDLRAVYADPQAIEKFQQAIKLLPDDNLLVGDAFKAKIVEDYKRWKKIADDGGIVIQQ
ncbi:Bug family tripartite tricarboxylate transporter substrate binding protein [Microvirga tunisiensis]|uniref:Tripartite tricarboxylate transporter substrate binding protein n=1 Tax=Microvirga tunisiensis TaxID=2108360 RepID=A0A5N7MG84_9HYPH|nr:tripartite tricarboxylate transporter substrate binding protein [Microvirga tunisiensis]MPR10339.1 tripartite tricarboxylate transporter substrate binding protein [Microvirga tunisiensis]MPR25985.1 tripartite tricarboxylate transporter substrate binding protein [Microvirga tunisiensis]